MADNRHLCKKVNKDVKSLLDCTGQSVFVLRMVLTGAQHLCDSVALGAYCPRYLAGRLGGIHWLPAVKLR
jgi:hypothetical protein